MEPIPVPAPPKSAFNKNRRVSDLLLAQLRHFQHVEHKQGIVIDPALARDLQTEGGAARYIAQMTRAIRSQAKTTPMAIVPKAAAKPAGALTGGDAEAGLSLAAAAEKTSARKRRRSKGSPRKSR